LFDDGAYAVAELSSRSETEARLVANGFPLASLSGDIARTDVGKLARAAFIAPFAARSAI